MSEEAFLRGLRADPDDTDLRLVFADWLDEHDDPRGELLRLLHDLTHTADLPDRGDRESRLRSLLTLGVQHVGPYWTNSLGMHFAWVPAGTFLMGSPLEEPERQDDETQHWVTLTHGFYLGVHPVTQAQWQAVLGSNPSRYRADTRPVECVSWEDCQRFCRELRARDGLLPTGTNPYRLPTEAEWEYAARGGTNTTFHFGDTLSTTQANFHTNTPRGSDGAGHYRQETTTVGLPPNAWGLTEMHGNVFEWCSDWYAPYPEGDVKDPRGKDEGDVRVLRGGSWHSLVARCRSACRGWGVPGYRGSDVGCRVCFRLEADFTL